MSFYITLSLCRCCASVYGMVPTFVCDGYYYLRVWWLLSSLWYRIIDERPQQANDHGSSLSTPFHTNGFRCISIRNIRITYTSPHTTFNIIPSTAIIVHNHATVNKYG